MEASIKYKSVADHATEFAALPRRKLQDKILYTGRVLVKERFEQAELPEDENYEHLQYYGPELTAAGRVMHALLRFYIPQDGEDITPNLRIRNLNEAARNGLEPIAVYDAKGRVE